jgi:hypothetical protein
LIDRSWQIVPATLLVTESGNCHWYGQRTPEMRANLEAHDIEVIATEQRLEPEVWCCKSRGPSLAHVARDCGFQLHSERGLDLLRAMPTLADVIEVPTEPEELLVANWQAMHVDATSKIEWKASSDTIQPGVHRDLSFTPALYVFRSPSGALIRLVDPIQKSAAKWSVIVQSTLPIAFKSSEKTLIVRPRIDLPLLVERALITASGFSPKYNANGTRSYSNIDRGRVVEVARILGVDSNKLES